MLGSFEARARIRAGIRSNNLERIAIVESRKYYKYRAVTVAFTSFDGFKEQLGKIYKEIDDLHSSIDLIFKQ